MAGTLEGCKRDLVTNPAYEDLKACFAEALRSNTARLRSVGSEDNIAKINTQAGICQGLELATNLLENYHTVNVREKKAA